MTDGGATPQTRAAARAAAATPDAAARSGGSGASSATAVPKRRFHWVRAASDRVPTTWFAGLGTAVLLVATAAFGGLATAAEAGPATISPGDEHRNDQLAVSVQGASLHDEDPAKRIYLEPGERMLIVRVRMENLYTEPQSAGAASDVTDNVSIAELADFSGLGDYTTVRADDGTTSPHLQPNVPADLEFRYVVAEDRFHEGDELHVTLNDLTLHIGSFVTNGWWWGEPEPAAEMILTITDDAPGGAG